MLSVARESLFDGVDKQCIADQTGQKKFLTPESMGMRKKYSSVEWNGTRPIKEMNEAAHPLCRKFSHLLPV